MSRRHQGGNTSERVALLTFSKCLRTAFASSGAKLSSRKSLNDDQKSPAIAVEVPAGAAAEVAGVLDAPEAEDDGPANNGTARPLEELCIVHGHATVHTHEQTCART